jgi:ATP-dependent Lhr-like helicase
MPSSSDEVLANVLDLLAGRYPSEEFGELRPRVVWDRIDGVIRPRAGAQRLAVTSGGTIVDRGLFGVFLPDGTRVGELDEEMVYESRPGETFLLGASTWRIEDITHERVVVTPAPGQPGKMPFWHGDGPGRPLELGRALGEFVRTIRTAPREEALATLQDRNELDPLAAQNLLAYLDEQAEACGGVVPDDRTIVVERFRDEIGDWRVCVHTPFGAQVHAPWAMALQARLVERWGVDVELIWSDDGIVMRLPDAIDVFPVEELSIDPAEIDELVIAQLPNSAMFAGRFRECAARALLLPRRRPDRRTPLWQQRQRAADLLTVAARYPDFPILLETTRECLNDVFDLPALREVLTDLRARRVRMVAVDTPRASPFAQSLLFGWIAVYMYEGDAPLAERRAAALALDRDLLRELLGAEELRELVDPAVLADLELELQRLTDGRRARDPDEVHDLLRLLGPLSRWEVEARTDTPDAETSSSVVGDWLDGLVRERRAIAVSVAGEERFAAAEDAARLRDALGVALPQGLPAAFTDPVPDPLADLVARFARTHGPFVTAQVAARYGVGADRALPVLERLEGDGRIVRGEFRPDGIEREWCDDDVLRQLRRRSLAALRREVEPVEGEALARFLPGWQNVGSTRHGLDAVVEAVGALQGLALPASVLETEVLSARVSDYRPADLDALCTAGELVWVGAGTLGTGDGRIRLLFRDQAGLLVVPPTDDELVDVLGEPVAAALHRHLGERGASFWPDLVAAAQSAGQPYDEPTVLDALWSLVWAGLVTNDSIAPLRSLLASGGRRKAAAKRSTAGGRGGYGSSRTVGRRPNLGRPALGSVSRLGPPAAAGRWSLVAPLLEPRPTATESAHATALQLLERYGVLTREAVLAEGVEGGFAAVYPVLKALEERGHVRRGYFVAGLGGAQFALPGAVDRLRVVREVETGDAPAEAAAIVVLAATDPAQPYGAALPWPESAGRPARAAGALVVLAAGTPVAYLERGGRSLVVFPTAEHHPGWAAALAGSVGRRGRRSRLEIARIDGEPAATSPHADALRAAGFRDGYRGLVLGGR